MKTLNISLFVTIRLFWSCILKDLADSILWQVPDSFIIYFSWCFAAGQKWWYFIYSETGYETCHETGNISGPICFSYNYCCTVQCPILLRQMVWTINLIFAFMFNKKKSLYLYTTSWVVISCNITNFLNLTGNDNNWDSIPRNFKWTWFDRTH